MSVVIAEAEVLVVGAGIMGLAAAYELAMTGREVLVLDRGEVGLEASGANAGTLAVQNKPLAAIPAVLDAVALWESLGERLDYNIEYERRGGFRLAHTEEDLSRLEQDVSDQRARDVPLEILRGGELKRAAPYLDEAVQGGSYCPLDGMANPLATVRAYLRAGQRQGVRVFTRQPVTGIDVGGDHEFLVRTPPGCIRARFVVSAAGAWTAEFSRALGAPLPVSLEVLQASITDSQPPLFPHIVTHVRGNLTLKQLRSGRILVGGGWRGRGDLQTGLKQPVRSSLSGNYVWATATLPGLRSARVLRVWPGFEGRTPDKLLLAGSLGGPRGAVVIGCGGGGFTFAPFAGRVAADLVNGIPVACSAAPFDPLRFSNQADRASAAI